MNPAFTAANPAFTGKYPAFTASRSLFTSQKLSFTGKYPLFTTAHLSFTGKYPAFTGKYLFFTGVYPFFTGRSLLFTAAGLSFTAARASSASANPSCETAFPGCCAHPRFSNPQLPCILLPRSESLCVTPLRRVGNQPSRQPKTRREPLMTARKFHFPFSVLLGGDRRLHDALADAEYAAALADRLHADTDTPADNFNG